MSPDLPANLNAVPGRCDALGRQVRTNVNNREIQKLLSWISVFFGRCSVDFKKFSRVGIVQDGRLRVVLEQHAELLFGLNHRLGSLLFLAMRNQAAGSGSSERHDHDNGRQQWPFMNEPSGDSQDDEGK